MNKFADHSKLSIEEVENIQGVISTWTSDNAVTRKPCTLLEEGCARIDFQGQDKPIINSPNFNRYAIQVGKKTYSVVHLQADANFGSELIRWAFGLSLEHRVHIFMARKSTAEFNKPKRDPKYDKLVIQRKQLNRNPTYVWSTKKVTEELFKKFDMSNKQPKK